MEDIARGFIDKSRSLMTSDYVPKIERCLDQLSDADIWWRPNEASNSIGNLILHLCGNVTMWIIGGVGQRCRSSGIGSSSSTSGDRFRLRSCGGA